MKYIIVGLLVIAVSVGIVSAHESSQETAVHWDMPMMGMMKAMEMLAHMKDCPMMK